MDISNWPNGKILQLPDYCFGRRWPVIFSGKDTTTGEFYLMSNLTLPERFVIWEINVAISMWTPGANPEHNWRLVLGDHLPTTVGEVDLMEPIFPDTSGSFSRNNVVGGITRMSRLKMLFHSSGRRMILYRLVSAYPDAMWAVAVVVSSVPKEVPDALCF